MPTADKPTRQTQIEMTRYKVFMTPFYVLLAHDYAIWILTVVANTAFFLANMARWSAGRHRLLAVCAAVAFSITIYRLEVHILGIAGMNGWFMSDQLFLLLEVLMAADLMRRDTTPMQSLLCQMLWMHFAVICVEYTIAEDGNRTLANLIYYSRAWAWIIIATLGAATIWLRDMRTEETFYGAPSAASN